MLRFPDYEASDRVDKGPLILPAAFNCHFDRPHPMMGSGEFRAVVWGRNREAGKGTRFEQFIEIHARLCFFYGCHEGMESKFDMFEPDGCPMSLLLTCLME